MNKLFGTNGVRGVVGSSMTPALAVRLGQAVGTWLPKGSKVAVGRDARSSGPHLNAAFCAGLNATGVHTVDIGILPSPGIQLYVRDKRFAAGGIITASHNPPEYNGIKLVAPDGTETSQDEEAAVEAIYYGESFRLVPWTEVGTHTTDGGAVDHYIEAVLKQVDKQAIRNAKLKVVLDPGGGAGCVTAPRLMSALGVQVVPLSCVLDGAFKDRPSEPSPANSKRCMEEVKRSKSHLGILQDGDADRAIFVDEKGDYVWGDRSLALGCLWELKRHPAGSTVCTAVSSSSCVADAVKMGGGKLEWTVVGSPVVAREMIRTHAVFGGEDNGGLMFKRHQICRDGLMAMAFVLELLAKTQRPLSSLLSEIPSYSLVKDKIHVPEEQKQAILGGYKQALGAESGIQSIDGRDGVKAYLADGWVLVRPSGTEPIYRIQAEAATAEKAQALVDRFKGVLTRTIDAMAPTPRTH
jgi:phosphomannomutase/phosphoglucomutase